MSSLISFVFMLFFFSSRRRHTRFSRDWSSDVCSSDLDPRGRRHTDPRRRPGRRQRLQQAAVDVRCRRGSDRKSVVQGKSVDLGGRRSIKKKKKQKNLESIVEARNQD